MDVYSLYTNISSKGGIDTVETTLKRKTIKTKIISTFLLLVLTLKKFVFKCQNYLHIRTTPWAYYMCVLEVRYISPFILMSKFYLRFIDDIFEIWTENTEQLMKFKQEIDKIHPSIKLNLILLIKR